MENNNTVSNSYEVGYGKPPKHTQFKPGYSGNKRAVLREAQTYLPQLKNCKMSVCASSTMGNKKVFR